jgi:hypothetical protein
MRILVAVGDVARDRRLIDVGLALADSDELVLASVIEVAPSRSLASAQSRARTRRRQLESFARREAIPARVVVKVARRAIDAIAEAVESERAELLVLGWPREPDANALDDLFAHPPCDLAVVHGDIGAARRILVPVRGGRYAQLAVAIASALAARSDGTVTLLHAT